MRNNKRIAFLNKHFFSAILMLLSALYMGCEPSQASKFDSERTGDVYSSNQETVSNVVAVRCEKKNFEYIINSTGKIKSLYDQIITSEINGEIMICNALNGKSICKGEQIMQLNTDPILQKLERGTLTKYNAEKEYESQLLGYTNLINGKSTEQADGIKKKLRISSGLAMAEQEIKEAKYDLMKTCIKAPFCGTLANVKVQKGELINAGQELLRIYDPKNLFAEIKILETDVAFLKKGMSAEVSAVSNSAVKYKAIINEINPYIDENGMALVKVKIVDPKVTVSMDKNGVLFPGMNCIIIIKIPFGEAVVVPKPAIVFRNNKPVVFTIDKGKAKWNYIELGRDNGVEVEIKNGLHIGQKIIITNNLQLGNNALVKEIPRDSSNDEE
jgi:membrane fusion protein, multidrug efflux system